MTKYIATFENGHELTATSGQFKNRLDFANYISRNRLGKLYGKLIKIECRPMPR